MASGSTINYDDLSSLRTKLNQILNGTGVHGGYNQSHSIAANPSTGDTVDDAYHDSIYSAAAKISNYYNISNPFTAVNAGTVIDWDRLRCMLRRNIHVTDIDTRVSTHPWTYAASNWDTSVQNETTRNSIKLERYKNTSRSN